jgi:hypothetical protein
MGVAQYTLLWQNEDVYFVQLPDFTKFQAFYSPLFSILHELFRLAEIGSERGSIGWVEE